jgi:aryl-alcohol dehydrogenase-like predicted oxidoreductase
MDYRYLGRSGLKVSTLTMGTMTFGGQGPFARVGNVGLDEARRLIDICIDAGVNLIDTANVYSGGLSEEDHRRGARRQAQERRADRLQGAHPHRQRTQ